METISKKNDVLYRIAELFELPPETVSGVPKLMVTGCKRIMIENHRGLLLLNPDLIKIKGGKVTVSVRGDKLDLIAMTGEEMLITGNIVSVEFE